MRSGDLVSALADLYRLESQMSDLRRSYSSAPAYGKAGMPGKRKVRRAFRIIRAAVKGMLFLLHTAAEDPRKSETVISDSLK